MPASTSWGKKETKKFILEKFPDGGTILDVGPGEGTYWRLFKDNDFILDGCEIFAPYIEKYQLCDKYDTVFNEDIRSFKAEKRYNVVIMGDILEHLFVTEAQAVVAYLATICEVLLVQVPYLYVQGVHCGNEAEIHHQPDLTEQIFLERYPDFTILLSSGMKKGHGIFYIET